MVLNYNGKMTYWLKKEIKRFPKLYPRLRKVDLDPLFAWICLALGLLYFLIIQDEKIVIVPDLGRELSYERWEIAALAWNAVFGALSYITLPIVDKTVPLFRVFGGIGLTWLALGYLEPENCTKHLWCAFFIALCYLIADTRISQKFSGQEGWQCSQTVLYADWPSVMAFSALLFFVHKYPRAEEMHVFLSGAIAFQFIASCLILALIESRVLALFRGFAANTIPSSSARLESLAARTGR